MDTLVHQISPPNFPKNQNPQHHHNHHHPSSPLDQQQHPQDQAGIGSVSSLLLAMNTNINNKPNNNNDKRYVPLLVVNYLCLFVGSVSSSLLSKYYFNHKGSSRWVSTWVQCAGFPLLLIPIFVPYHLLKFTERKPFTRFTPKITIISIFIGFLLGINNLLFSWGNSYLPVSTSSLLLSSQLAFNLILSVIIVKQRITFSNLNCVILLTLSSVLIALGSNNDKPQGLTRSKYFIGFFSTIGAGLLFALYLPLMEKLFRKVYCFEMVMEMQLVMEIAATVLATIGMALDGGFSEIRNESKKVFDKGEKVYWVTVFSNVVTWQLCFMGTAGMVFLTSSITGGICMTALMGMNVLGGVLVYGDEFGGVKAVSTVLCVWGFCSYVYGMYIKMRDDKRNNSSGATTATTTMEMVNNNDGGV
ncbi:hypothetical protein FEM48_Zijuj01G0029800 [Ziziphus jujuba var. spinosa]|uniref:Probable purine permease n=1 Tax=Ziziphus jujuba var. spinosa TaxID=714518 RepID=A0A978VYR6_ZIZJJ|nr:hypothetical protein FEM48_Zijuj01G0029800 [Ziziphus jujuba var. spinosa]